MIRICFAYPYEEANTILEKVIHGRQDCENVSLTYMPAEGKNFSIADIPPADVYIARGGTAISLRKRGFHVAEIDIMESDIIRGVDECIRKFHAKRIGIVTTKNMIKNRSSIERAYPDTEFLYRFYEEVYDIPRLIADLQLENVDALVGGRSCSIAASKTGVPSVLLETNEDAVSIAITKALDMTMMIHQNQFRDTQVETIMDHTFEGIIIFNKDGDIIQVNKFAQVALKRAGFRSFGQNIGDIFPFLNINEITEGKKEQIFDTCRMGDMVISINCVSLNFGEEFFGGIITFQDVTLIHSLTRNAGAKLRNNGFMARHTFESLVCEDPDMKEVIRCARQFALHDRNLLIFGETGTGKEVIAQSIHNASFRKNGPFVAINCAAIPEQLLESELFGYVGGAFTGATKGGKRGLFELANNGTLFLDEIGDIPMLLQSKLLRVIQEREIIRLGDDRVIPINVRIICATNRDLSELVESGAFRRDLFYRLEVLRLFIPPVRERKNDIIPLIFRHIETSPYKDGTVIKSISPGARRMLLDYPWPGNVREINNFCERISVFCTEEELGEAAVRLALNIGSSRQAPAQPSPSANAAPRAANGITSASADLTKARGEAEKELIADALRRCGSSRTLAAKSLGIDKSTLWRKIKKYGIEA